MKLTSPWRCSLLQSFDQGQQFVAPRIGLCRRVEDLAIVPATVGRPWRGRIQNHFARHSTRKAGPIEKILRKIWYDHDIAGGIGPYRYSPHDLVEVERIDVLVDDDHELGVTEAVRRGQDAHPDGLGKAAVAHPRRHDDNEAVGIERVDGYDLGKHLVQLNENRRAGGHRLEEVEFGPRPPDIDGFKDWVLPVRNPIDLDDRIFVAAGIVSRKLAEQ